MPLGSSGLPAAWAKVPLAPSCTEAELEAKKTMDWRYNTIWFEQLDQSRVMSLDLRASSLPSFGVEQYVSLRGYRQQNGVLDALPTSDEVLYLELSFSN